MASLSTYEYYRDDLSKIPPLRAIAETLLASDKVREVTCAEAYELAQLQGDVAVSDMLVYPPAAERLGLPKGAKLLNNCHGKIIGRTATARRFFNKLDSAGKEKVLKDCREAISDLQLRGDLIKAEAVVGLDEDLMIKATIIGDAKTDAVNIFSWLCNFTPFAELKEKYDNSKKLPILDIIVIGDNLWTCNDPFYENIGKPMLALVDETANVIYNLGMRYFGERKKGTLTLAWTSGMKVGMAACHGGIKEFDFSGCEDEAVAKLGKKAIAFFGLSGTGKSSHTNSLNNAGTMPKGTTKVVLHDDAFQIDSEDMCCRVWEPSLFDKTDQRGLDHPEWKYALSVMNTGMIQEAGLKKIIGLEIRNANGRAIYDRDLVGDYVNKCGFPQALVWLMKDTCLPPILKFTDTNLAVAMGAALITKRNRAENVTEEELKKLAFIPYANPFRVYPLHKDVAAFAKVFDNGAECYCFNSGGMWGASDTELRDVKLSTSLTLQTAITIGQLEWEDWDLLEGAQIPTKESIEKILPGFYDKYSTDTVENRDEYISTLKDRFQQRRDFLAGADQLGGQPELLKKLQSSMTVKA